MKASYPVEKSLILSHFYTFSIFGFVLDYNDWMEVKTGKYKHSKSGKEYRVIGVGKHSETLEEMVIYEALYDNETSKLWVRPAAMWSELVEIGGEQVPRFQWVSE
jgi:hypothetical protein